MGFVVEDGGEQVPVDVDSQHGGGTDEYLRADVQSGHLRRRQFGDRRGHHGGVLCGRVRDEEFFDEQWEPVRAVVQQFEQPGRCDVVGDVIENGE